MSPTVAAALRFSVLLSPVGLAVLATPVVAPLLAPTAAWTLLLILVLLGIYGALVAASERIPGQSWLNGLKAFVAHGVELRAVALQRVAGAHRTVKVLDSYWGDIDQFRVPLKRALDNFPRCQVLILLARKHGHFASIRDAAMPGEVAVNDHLDSNLRSVEELRVFLRNYAPGLAERVFLKDFDAIVPGPLLIVDDSEVFVGSFTQAGGSPQSPALIVKHSWFRKSDAVIAYVTTFDRLWNTN